MNCKTFLLSFTLCCTLFSCCHADIFRSEDFKMLGCSEQRNITIILNGAHRFLWNRLTYLLDNVIGNEDCFTVYFYHQGYDDAIRLRKDNHVNQLEMSFRYDDFNYAGILPQNTVNFLEKKLEEKNTSKQTLFYNTLWLLMKEKWI